MPLIHSFITDVVRSSTFLKRLPGIPLALCWNFLRRAEYSSSSLSLLNSTTVLTFRRRRHRPTPSLPMLELSLTHVLSKMSCISITCCRLPAFNLAYPGLIFIRTSRSSCSTCSSEGGWRPYPLNAIY